MDEDAVKTFKKVIDNPDAPDYMKFKAEIFLLFDRYDPFNPETTITPEQFFGTVDFELRCMHYHFMAAMHNCGEDIPPFVKLEQKDEEFLGGQ